MNLQHAPRWPAATGVLLLIDDSAGCNAVRQKQHGESYPSKYPSSRLATPGYENLFERAESIMNECIFYVVPQTDKGYFEAFNRLKEDGGFPPSKVQYGDIEASPQELTSHEELHKVFNQNVKVFNQITYKYSSDQSIRIIRQADASSLYDKVIIHPQQQKDHFAFVRLCAAAQKYLGASSLSNLGNLLGPEAQKHFEAREIALAKLEKLTATLLLDTEKARQDRDREFQAKEKALEDKFEQRQSELDGQQEARQKELDERSAELDNLRKELDDRAAKHARRQHYKDIKEKFQSWSEQFQVTKGTSDLRRSVTWMTILLLLLFGGLAGYFLLQSIDAEDNTHFIAAIIKQVTSTILFVSIAFFFIRWNNEWFQKHANEEFRLKRMELDIDRASWFVEMAFEWQDDKGEEIPSSIVERLTAGLFREEGNEPSSEQHDSLAQTLLGASRFTVKLSDGTEVEYDRRGVQKLLQDKRKS